MNLNKVFIISASVAILSGMCLFTMNGQEKPVNTVAPAARLVDGDAQWPADEGRFNHHMKYNVTVSCEGRKTSFKFYGSFNDWHKGIEELNEDGLKDALLSFILDTVAGENDFNDFCNEFGYDNDSRRAFSIWKQCKKVNERAARLFPGLNYWEIQEFIND